MAPSSAALIALYEPNPNHTPHYVAVTVTATSHPPHSPPLLRCSINILNRTRETRTALQYLKKKFLPSPEPRLPSPEPRLPSPELCHHPEPGLSIFIIVSEHGEW